MRILGGGKTAAAAGLFARQEAPSALRPYLLDSLYLGGLLAAIPYLVATGKGRQVLDHLRRRARDIAPRAGERPCAWVHGVSVGEILSARRFLVRFAEEFPEWELVLSTTTRAGLEAGARHFPDFRFIPYPFDLSYFVRRTFDRIRPDLVIIVEHELWPNFLWHSLDRGVPVAIANGRMSERSLRGYRWLSRLVSWPPPGLTAICVEDEVSAGAFQRLGVDPERIRVTGNLKFDNALEEPQGIRLELGLDPSSWVLAAASTHPGEEAILLDAFAAIHREDRGARLIIAPRRVERGEEIIRLARRRGLAVERWSARRRAAANGASGGCGAAEVIVVDTFGDLHRILAAGDVVFVGGSLVPFGGHNVIEPASIGRPVIIGPCHGNFRCVVSSFRGRDAILIAEDGGDLLEKLRILKRDPARARGLASRARATIADCSGASERTLEALRPLIESAGIRRRAAIPACR